MRMLLKTTLALFLGITPLFAHTESIEIGPENTHDLPRGKEADGIIGDFVLRNDYVQALISGNQPGRRANMSTFWGLDGITPGCLYDLTFRDGGNDQITIFSPAEQRGPVSQVRIVEDIGAEESIIETILSAASNEGVFKRHEYRVTEESRGVYIKTTFRNEALEARKIKLYDRWTAFTRTNLFGSFRWADAVDPADRWGYAFKPYLFEGDEKPIDETEIGPDEEIEIERFLAVGRSPAEAVGWAATELGGTGHLVARVRDANGVPIPHVELVIRSDNEEVPAYTDEQGLLSIPFPAGKFHITALDRGRETSRKEIEVKEDETAEVAFELSARSSITLEITDREGRDLPCKAQFLGIEGTPSPRLGPPNRAHGCNDQYHSEKGRFTVPIAAGKYRVVVTRGIEYSHLARDITVAPGENVKFSGQLERLVDTRGWISADYHNHSTPSGDNTTGTDDRIINLAAEHIEFAPTTEHNRFYDWRPHIEKLALTRHIQTVSGIELTGSGPHLNSFPFHPHPHVQDGGAPVWNRDPRISALLLRNHQTPNPDRWIQINHPDLVENFIDHNGDGLADGGYIGLGHFIDGVEVQNFAVSRILNRFPISIVGTNVLRHREFLWLQLLNRGHRLVGMAVSDAHSVHGNGVGGWRMYMPSQSDEPAEIDWRENSRHAKSGRSILTTGPFLQVQTPEGAGPGADIRAAGAVDLKVKVQCTDWIDINRVQVLVNGRPRPELNFTRTKNPDMFQDSVVKFDRTLRVPLSQDAHLIVVVLHEERDLSLGYGTSDQAKLRPIAFHNPIFVDVDGGGFQANGDMLDYPLGIGKFTLEEARQLLAQ
jgi:hypothetical protein